MQIKKKEEEAIRKKRELYSHNFKETEIERDARREH